jgi:hypothetical protein
MDLAEDAVRCEPVSPCIFGKCREILPKCREEISGAPLKTARCHKLECDSPYSRSREGIAV